MIARILVIAALVLAAIGLFIVAVLDKRYDDLALALSLAGVGSLAVAALL